MQLYACTVQTPCFLQIPSCKIVNLGGKNKAPKSLLDLQVPITFLEADEANETVSFSRLANSVNKHVQFPCTARHCSDSDIEATNQRRYCTATTVELRSMGLILSGQISYTRQLWRCQDRTVVQCEVHEFWTLLGARTGSPDNIIDCEPSITYPGCDMYSCSNSGFKSVESSMYCTALCLAPPCVGGKGRSLL